jgi:hypothetical protein
VQEFAAGRKWQAHKGVLTVWLDGGEATLGDACHYRGEVLAGDLNIGRKSRTNGRS